MKHNPYATMCVLQVMQVSIQL